ncbi:MAG: hypothetical protein JWN24_1420 [Phycisphaerales bacterium]|nr:hypothetical protein [Phycisphaerales bacterium]
MNDVNKQLARQARQEAGRATPAFSEALHARILRAVDAADCRAVETEGEALPRRGVFVIGMRHPWRVALAMAACVALALTPLNLRLLRPQTPPIATGPVGPKHVERVMAKADPTPIEINKTARQVNKRVTDVVETAMAEQQWAGLDQDVRQATRYLADRVPFRAAWENDGRDH